MLTPAQAATDWLTFGGNFQRQGFNSDESTLTVAAVPGLKLHWSNKIGRSATQPLLVRQVGTSQGPVDLVFAVSEGNVVHAFNALTGKTVWSVNLGTPTNPCTNGHAPAPAHFFQTPTIDPGAQLMYLVDGKGLLHALAIGNGSEAAGFPVDVVDIAGVGVATQAFGSPTIVGQSIYLTTALNLGCGQETKQNYVGQVIEFDLGRLQVTNRFTPSPGPNFGGGTWGPGGVSAETDGSALYDLTGNAANHGKPKNLGLAENVIKLDPSLNVLASNDPTQVASCDCDFGATPLIFDPPGCGPLTAAMNKNGMLYLYNRNSIGSGPAQQLQVSISSGSGDFIGIPAWDPTDDMIFLGNTNDSASFAHGLLGFNINNSCQLALAWSTPAGLHNISGDNPAIPPTVADGVVWWGDGIAGELFAMQASNGSVLWSSGGTIAAGGIFGAPTVANGQVFVVGGGVLYAFGL